MEEKGGTCHSAVADLQRLENLQEKRRGVLVEEIACSVHSRAVDLVCAEDGGEGGGEVGQHAGETNVECLLRHSGEVEGVADGVLRCVSL